MSIFPLTRLGRSSGSLKLAICAGVLLLAVAAGVRTSALWLALPAAAAGAVVLLAHPVLGLLALVFAALLVSIDVSTGTAVTLNAATLLVPALLGVWLLDMVYQRKLHLAPSATNRPLFLLLLAGLLSLLVGTALWDPAVPRPGSFTLVQLAQWGIFALSAGAFWLAGNLVTDETWLRRLAFAFLLLAGAVALLFVLIDFGLFSNRLVSRVVTGAVIRAPFWLLLGTLAGGQLLFNGELSIRWRVVLVVGLGATLIYAFVIQRAAASNWVAILAAGGILAWLRWPRLRWPVIILLVVVALSGVLTSAVYEFAGGDAEWQESGGSRMALIGRVLEVTMRNPITGLGPAAYRPYAGIKPLSYGQAFWVSPQINSHNNYVDLFAHVGLLGLALFLWFAIEVIRSALRLRQRFHAGFAAGYVNAMLAVWVGALILMLFADWILPFVYNIGFPGFQASVLVWLFLGGLVTLEGIAAGQSSR